MPLTVRAGPYGASSSAAASAVITETAGNPQTGDVRFAFMINSPTATITPPTGWTVLFNGNTPSTRTGAIFYRPWVAGVGSQTITFSNGVVALQVISLGGMDTTATPQVSIAGVNATGTTATVTALTPTTADQLALIWAAWVFNSPQTGADSVTFTSPAGTTQAGVARPTGSTTGYDGVISTAALTSTATTPAYTTTASTTATARLSGLVLVPAVASGPTRTGSFFPFLGLGTGVAR